VLAFAGFCGGRSQPRWRHAAREPCKEELGIALKGSLAEGKGSRQHQRHLRGHQWKYQKPHLQPLSQQQPTNFRKGGISVMLLVACIWGTTPPSLRLLFTAVHAPNPLLAMAIPNAVAFLTMLLFAGFSSGSLGKLAKDKTSLVGGLETGLWYYAAFTTAAFGVARTSATNAAFLSQLSTLFVPFLQMWQGVKVGSRTLGACGMASAGCLLLALAGGRACNGVANFEGDFLCLLASMCYTLHNIRLEHYTMRGDPAVITFWSKVAQALLGLIILLVVGRVSHSPGGLLGFLAAASSTEVLRFAQFCIWNGIFVKGIATFLQTKAYAAISPSVGEVALSTTPLWALLFAVGFIGEPFNAFTLTGVALFVCSIMICARENQPASANNS